MEIPFIAPFAKLIIGNCLGALLLLGLFFWLGFRKLLQKLEENSTFRAWLAGSESIFTLAVGASIGVFDLYKLTAWQEESKSLPGGMFFLVLSLGLICSVKSALWIIKEKDKAKIIALEKDIEAANLDLEKITEEREWRTWLSAVIGGLVESKCKKLRELGKRESVTVDEFLRELDPQAQIKLTLTVLHELFRTRLKPNMSLRLAVYLEQDGYLAPFYAWNGQMSDCFSGSSKDHMLINDPSGSRTLMTQLYHSTETFRLVSDCQMASQRNEFTFLRPDQQDRIKSIVAAKKIIYSDKRRIVILTMDSDQNNFFEQKEKEAIKLSLDVMPLSKRGGVEKERCTNELHG